MTDNDPEGRSPTSPGTRRTPTPNLDTLRVAELGLGAANKALEKMGQAMVPEGLSAVGDLAERLRLDFAGPESELGKSLRAMADQLRVPAIDFSNYEPAILDIGPSPEAKAAWEIREEVSSLREVTATMAATVAAIADIANDLKPSLTDYAVGAQKSATIQTRLTWALVGLTVVIAILTGVLVFGGS